MTRTMFLTLACLLLLPLIYPAPAPAAEAPTGAPRRWFVKGTVGGGGVDSIRLYMQIKSKDTGIIKEAIARWGPAYSFRLGYDFSRRVGAEAFYKHIKSKPREKITDGGGDFQVSSWGATFFYCFSDWTPADFPTWTPADSSARLYAYVGAGAAYHTGATLHRWSSLAPGVNTTVRYKDTFGAQGLLGCAVSIRNLLLFSEFGYPIVTYKFKQIWENGQTTTHETDVLSEWRKVHGRWFFDFGLGYYF